MRRVDRWSGCASPRPDSPSLFGALLDRAAGSFRFGPSTTMVPNHRRYVPGTNVLETTWHTPSGWLTVWGFPRHRTVRSGAAAQGLPPRTRRRLRAGDLAAHRELLRRARRGRGRLHPAVRLRAHHGEWSYDGTGYDKLTVRQGDHTLHMVSSMRLGTIGARGYGRKTLEAGQSAFVALAWGDRAPETEDAARTTSSTARRPSGATG